MTTTLTFLAWTLVLALVQILLAAGFKRQQDTLQWAAGNRDTPQQYSGTAARLARAQANLFETLPLIVGGILIAHVAGRETAMVVWGAGLYFVARLAYVPCYAFGLGPVRSVVWGVSIVGLVLVLLGLT